MRPRRFGPTNSLMQVAAAVVGTAAAAKVIPARRWCHCDEQGYPGPHEVSDGCDPAGPLGAAIPAPDVADEVVNQQAEHTYRADLPEGAYGNGHPAQQDIVGANGRRLILRWVPEGVYVGGCLITDREVAESLVRFITREDEGL